MSIVLQKTKKVLTIGNLSADDWSVIVSFLTLADFAKLLQTCKTIYIDCNHAYNWYIQSRYLFIPAYLPPIIEPQDNAVVTSDLRLPIAERIERELRTRWSAREQYKFRFQLVNAKTSLLVLEKDIYDLKGKISTQKNNLHNNKRTLKRKRRQVEKAKQTIEELHRVVWPEPSLAGVDEHLDDLFGWIPGKDKEPTKRRRTMPDFIIRSTLKKGECPTSRTRRRKPDARLF